ncbi:MAG: anthranilate phosphoribosyltransferase [Sphingomonadales bacterium]|nr:anthranilate phosphoribosyltransferase [Sphingomonadales bacterium]
MLDGALSDSEIADTLIALADKGETADEIAGAASAMRARMIRVSGPANAIDVCGTGGDGQHSLNVSTAVALVIAACDVPVAKHGNRAASSKAGGADTLEALGLSLDRANETAEETLADLGIAFLFAQKHHPALARIAPIRKALGRRTIFNLLGPLCNPAGVTRQLVGVASPALIPVYSGALAALGTERAMVVSGCEGLDELSISGPSEIATIGFGLPSHIVTPEDAGLPRHPAEALRGDDAAYNAAALRRLLMGERGAYRDAVLLNAAVALLVAGEADSWPQGVEEAAEAIDKGLAKALLDCWVAF